jgi:hypothetical protein
MPRPKLALWGLFAAALTFAVAARAENPAHERSDSLVLLPAQQIVLDGPAARQRVLVEARRDGYFTGPSAGATIESSDENVVTIENGVAVPMANGQATLTAKHGDQTATVSVEVRNFDQPFEPSFRSDVLSVFSKAGCNGGACHGALAGKAGFRLSLHGYDPEGDHTSVTKLARGRRIVPSDPGRSLLLTKPTGAIPHKGGFRFDVGSEDYKVIASWIAAGAKPPAADDARLERLEVLPEQALLTPGSEQPLVVLGHFSDGRTVDVTRWAKFTSTSDSVAGVNQQGVVKVAGHGECAVNAWYLSQNVIATISVPFEQQPATEVAKAAPRNFIDELVLEKLTSLNIPPSPRSSDEEFLRRVFLDTIGVLPTADEARAFLADASPDKRDKLIDSLLARPEFVDYWAYKWSDLLLVNSQRLSSSAMWSYYHWIRNQVAADTPWDKLARSVVTAKGSNLENGAANFYLLHNDPANLAETASMAFLGMSVACAKCHNHPLEKWTNDQYFGLASLFARVRLKEGDRSDGTIVYAVPEGELVQPRTGKPQPPRPLDAAPIAFDNPGDRREVFADWLVSPDNPYFSRAITNRIWANFFGVGLVEAVDDLRLTNPASNRKLLAAAAKYLVDHGYDTKALMKAILQSETYQRSSAPVAGNENDTRYYSRYYPRRLMAEVLLDGISQATGVPTEFSGYPAGTRAVQLPDANVDSYFLTSFGRAQRNITCECERSEEPSMAQVLHIANGDGVNKKLAEADNRIGKLLADNATDEQVIEDVFLGALSRRPTDAEKKDLLAGLAEAGPDDRRTALEDLYWGVLSTKEFLFNH